MQLVFFPVDNSKDVAPIQFDGWCAEDIMRDIFKLQKNGDEIRRFNTDIPLQMNDLSNQYNREELDGGWYCMSLNLTEDEVDKIEESVYSEDSNIDTDDSFDDLVFESYNLTEKMSVKLRLLLKKQPDKFIRTLRKNTDDERDNISAYVYDKENERFVERCCMAIQIVDNRFLVCADTLPKDDDDFDELNEKLSSGNGNWYDLTGGDILIQPTVKSLCESIEQYTNVR